MFLSEIDDSWDYKTGSYHSNLMYAAFDSLVCFNVWI